MRFSVWQTIGITLAIIVSGLAILSQIVLAPEVINQTCGLTTCHGLDLACGTNAPEVCTDMYQGGDRCRKFASCTDSCELALDPRFESCKTCVDQCQTQFPSDGQAYFQCESQCGE